MNDHEETVSYVVGYDIVDGQCVFDVDVTEMQRVGKRFCDDQVAITLKALPIRTA